MIFAECLGKQKGGRVTTFRRMIPIWVLGLVFGVLGIAPQALAQTSTGSEQVTNISSGQANLGQNLPAQNYSLTTGLNTFIVPSVPTNAAIRIQITNETANICSGAFQVTVWTTLERQISSFNNNLNVWQLVPMISPSTGAYVGNTGLLTIGAFQTTLLTTAAVAGNVVAIQVVNTTGACPTTNIDVVATFVSTAITSSLVTVASNGQIQPAGIANQVQGIIPQQQNGVNVFPVVNGGLELAVNGNFANVGIDTFNSGIELSSSGSGCISGQQCTTSITGPVPTKVGEFGLAFESTVGSSGGSPNPACPLSAASCILPPWTAIPSTACNGAAPQGCAATLANIPANQILSQAIGQASISGFNVAGIVISSSPSTAARQGNTVAGNAAAFTSNTLAGSTLVAALGCATTTPCSIASVADTQGLVWRQILFQPGVPGSQQSGLAIWAAANTSSAAADTVTFTLATGTATSTTVVELTGTTPTQLTTPAISAQVDATGRTVVALDAQGSNLFNCTVTLSSLTTTQCQAAPTVINGSPFVPSGVPARLYVTDFQINTTAAGTATTIQLKTGTGTNCATGTANLSAIAYPNTAIGINSILGTRTPLISPVQSALCATQAGTTTGTSVVEIRGFIAP